METLLEAALWHANRDVPVFPCWPRKKIPATENGFYDAVIDEQIIRGWWSENPNYNLAVPTGAVSGFIVLDIDGEELANKWLEQNGHIIPDTTTVKTGKGKHIYLRHPGLKVGNRTSNNPLAPGIELKADGGYVMAPPSVHPDTLEPYEWLQRPDETGVAECPPWLLDELMERAERPIRGNRSEEEPSNGDMATLAAVMAQRGLPEHVIRHTLRQTAPLFEQPHTNGSHRLHRTSLGDALLNGVPEPEELEPDILLKGKAHQIFTGKEQGKTWVALWLAKKTVNRGQTVLLFDMENGKRIISERLQLLGVDSGSVDEHLHYFDYPALDTSKESRAEYEALLDKLRPDLIIFDSWLGFLGKCGFDENSNTDLEKWDAAYVHPAKARDATVVVLDHVPHEVKERSRGASRKGDVMDVQWKLKKTEPFDRGTVGYIQLTKEKDREAWLPAKVGFSIGGTEEGFIFRRSEGTITELSGKLTESAWVALEALDTCGVVGATYTEWRDSIEWKGATMPDSTFRKALTRLKDAERVSQQGDTYYSTAQHSNSVAA